ncbi:MAG TPA: peptidyl-tRNA hydrolase, partial [Candidatus Enterenecus faecium]|nr:peptidyl-tRNA hydrolase [Candidatus Enterenecus faecium]
MMFQRDSGGAAWLIVGLGNPGEKYEDTRHNVGFQVIDELAERQGRPVQRLKFKALTGLLTISGEKALVMKPVTYMNLSGEAVRPAADFYKLPPERILVISD